MHAYLALIFVFGMLLARFKLLILVPAVVIMTAAAEVAHHYIAGSSLFLLIVLGLICQQIGYLVGAGLISITARMTARPFWHNHLPTR